MLGFWIYLMSDCLIFAVLFATYGVLGGNYAAGPAPKRPVRPAAGGAQHGDAAVVLDHLWLRHAGDGAGSVGGDADLARRHRRCSASRFLGIELYEFAHLIHEGATPQRSAFLSSFFTLVGTHGLHVTFGIDLAGHADGAGRQARADRRPTAAG